MKKFFNVCRKVAIFGAGAFTAVAVEYGLDGWLASGLILAGLVYVLSIVAEKQIPEQKEEEEMTDNG